MSKLKFLILFLICFNLFSNENNNTLYYKFCGVWDFDLNTWNGIYSFSWGESKYQINSSLIIAYNPNEKYIFSPGIKADIMNIEKIGENKYLIKAKYENNNFNLIMNLNEDGSIWFDKNTFTSITTSDKPLYRFNNPIKGKYLQIRFVPIVRLKLRKSPSLNSRVVDILEINEEVKLIIRKDEATIDGIKGEWVKVETNDGKTGWCFNGYLKEKIYYK